MKFTGICTQQDQFTGSTTQKDFLINNCHKLQFVNSGDFIGVSIAGFSSSYLFYFNPKGKQVKLNQYFIDRYVMTCDNASELLSYFNL